MSTRRQLAGLTLGTAAALSIGAVAIAQPLPPPPTPPSPSAPPDPTASPSPSPTAGPSPSAGPPPPGEPEALVFSARRTELTLPNVPTLGIPYVCLLDLFDETARQVGTATAGSMVVGVTLGGPVVLASVVMHLPDGEIHYQRIMDRSSAFPRTSVGAIHGGTGAYRDARGEVDITWPDEERVDLLVRIT